MRRWVLIIDKWKVRAERDGGRTREPVTVDAGGEVTLWTRACAEQCGLLWNGR